jgi:hypothetical protein
VTSVPNSTRLVTAASAQGDVTLQYRSRRPTERQLQHVIHHPQRCESRRLQPRPRRGRSIVVGGSASTIREESGSCNPYVAMRSNLDLRNRKANGGVNECMWIRSKCTSIAAALVLTSCECVGRLDQRRVGSSEPSSRCRQKAEPVAEIRRRCRRGSR